MKTFANIVSFLFHPLLMVTYGVLLAMMFTYLSIYPDKAKLLIIVGALLVTCIIPALFILLIIRTGGASDIELTDRRERVLPYLVIIASILLYTYYMYRMMMPNWLLLILIGGIIALLIALCVNFVWKISAHSIGIGGLMGGVMGVCRIHLMNPFWAFMLLFLIAGLVCSSRIYLKRHTPMQTYAGFGLGFICTFTASLISYIYLFI
ncbi:hypothetical protein [Parabacteroides sp. PF5-9]|uniref:hypothetical protein n=1 Tax=Parabacteroides sp. PF5-9 TaxID=1742404 RepID=UPI0032AF57E3